MTEEYAEGSCCPPRDPFELIHSMDNTFDILIASKKGGKELLKPIKHISAGQASISVLHTLGGPKYYYHNCPSEGKYWAFIYEPGDLTITNDLALSIMGDYAELSKLESDIKEGFGKDRAFVLPGLDKKIILKNIKSVKYVDEIIEDTK